MRDAQLYKEANERGYALRFHDDGAYLINIEDGTKLQVVEVTEKGIHSVVPSTWEADFGTKLARMMRAEVARATKAEKQPELYLSN